MRSFVRKLLVLVFLYSSITSAMVVPFRANFHYKPETPKQSGWVFKNLNLAPASLRMPLPISTPGNPTSPFRVMVLIDRDGEQAQYMRVGLGQLFEVPPSASVQIVIPDDEAMRWRGVDFIAPEGMIDLLASTELRTLRNRATVLSQERERATAALNLERERIAREIEQSNLRQENIASQLAEIEREMEIAKQAITSQEKIDREKEGLPSSLSDSDLARRLLHYHDREDEDYDKDDRKYDGVSIAAIGNPVSIGLSSSAPK